MGRCDIASLSLITCTLLCLVKHIIPLLHEPTYFTWSCETLFHHQRILKMLQNSLTQTSRTCYLWDHPQVIKSGQLHLAWNYAQNPEDHQCFINMLQVSPGVFQVLLNLIEEHSIFQNNSNNSQRPVEVQLATTLYRMGRYGNGASLEDVA